jgi:hypothetical protein
VVLQRCLYVPSERPFASWMDVLLTIISSWAIIEPPRPLSIYTRGLFYLQHCGQGTAGISVCHGGRVYQCKANGMAQRRWLTLIYRSKWLGKLGAFRVIVASSSLAISNPHIVNVSLITLFLPALHVAVRDFANHRYGWRYSKQNSDPVPLMHECKRTSPIHCSWSVSSGSDFIFPSMV